MSPQSCMAGSPCPLRAVGSQPCVPTELWVGSDRGWGVLWGPLWCPHGLWCPSPVSPVPAELQDTARRFSQGGVSHYLTLTLDEAEALLYVGAREAVFALATGTVELKAAVRTPKTGRVWGGGCSASP